MIKFLFITTGLLLAGVPLLVGPAAYKDVVSARQRQALLTRTDYPEIARACAGIAQSATKGFPFVAVSDSRVPESLRSLAPRFITAWTNELTVDFQGGSKPYGYKLRPAATTPGQWTLFFFTLEGEQPLATITLDANQPLPHSQNPQSSPLLMW